jgi:hypothetical protein
MANDLGVFTNTSNSDIIGGNDGVFHNFILIVSNYTKPTKVRIEYTIDKINWYNVTDYDYEITGNGSYNLVVNENLTVGNLRFVYVSGDATIQVYYNNK